MKASKIITVFMMISIQINRRIKKMRQNPFLRQISKTNIILSTAQKPLSRRSNRSCPSLNPFLSRKDLTKMKKKYTNEKEEYKHSKNKPISVEKNFDNRPKSVCSFSMHNHYETLAQISDCQSVKSYKDAHYFHSNKRSWQKQYEITKSQMKLYGPQIIRYKIDQISVKKQYYNSQNEQSKFKVKKNKKNNQNYGQASAEYFFVSQAPRNNLQQKEAIYYPKNQHKQRKTCRNRTPQISCETAQVLNNTGKKKLKIQKSLSWNTEIEAVYADNQKNNPSLTPFHQQKQICQEEQFYDMIIEDTFAQSGSLIKCASGNPLSYKSGQMSDSWRKEPLSNSNCLMKMSFNSSPYSSSENFKQKVGLIKSIKQNSGGKQFSHLKDSRGLSKFARLGNNLLESQRPQSLKYQQKIFYNIAV